MVVKNYVAKLNDNNCIHIKNYMNSGMTAIEAFSLETKKNRHNPNKIIGYEYRNDKWYWLFMLLKIEIDELNMVQYTQPC